jgi:DNA polymerase/3'-5' exonuclease PolX
MKLKINDGGSLMLKRAIALSVFAIFLVAGCGGTKYGDIKDVMNSQIDAMEKFVASVEKAGSGKEIADAINAYSDDMKQIIPKMNDLIKKYPEMKGEDPPPELKDLLSLTEEKSKKFARAMVKVAMKHAKDPEVGKALKNMGKAMKGLVK